jgi:hypothetical protein
LIDPATRLEEDVTMRSLKDLVARLWADDLGSVIASEYLMLGGVVGLGSVAGLSALRDAANHEMEEFGQTVRVVNRSYRENIQRYLYQELPGRSAPRSQPFSDNPHSLTP